MLNRNFLFFSDLSIQYENFVKNIAIEKTTILKRRVHQDIGCTIS